MEGETDSLRKRANRNGINFLFIDLDLASTFMDVAEGSQNKETARRNHSNVRKAYDAVMRLLPKLRPDEQERQELDRKLSLLKSRLQAIGHQF